MWRECVRTEFKNLTFDPTKGVRGRGKILIIVMLIYRHLVIMAYSEKLSDIIAMRKWEVYHTKKVTLAFAFWHICKLNSNSQHQEVVVHDILKESVNLQILVFKWI